MRCRIHGTRPRAPRGGVERDRLDAQRAVTIRDHHHCLLSLAASPPVLPGATDESGGTTPGAAPVRGGGVVPGGGLSGPLMPQAAIESTTALTMKAIRQRRNIARACVAKSECGKVYHAHEERFVE